MLKEEVLKDKVEVKSDIDIEILIRNVMAKEFNVLEERLFNGLRQIIYNGRDSIIKYHDEKFNEIKRMLQDKGFEVEDPKQKEIMEYLDKLKMLVGGRDGR